MTADFDAYLVRKIAEQKAIVEKARELALCAERLRRNQYESLAEKIFDAVLLAEAWMEEHDLAEDEE